MFVPQHPNLVQNPLAKTKGVKTDGATSDQ
jgi:hypothetical protein